MEMNVRDFSVRLRLLVFLLWGSLTGYAQVTITATVGTASGSFTTLKGAFDAINAGTHRGVIEIKINANTTESASAVLNASGSGSASYTGITIYPTVSGLSISGALAGVLIKLNGADNVTIDGRVNASGSTRDLTISNTGSGTSTAPVTIQFISDASGNTVKYCKLKGSSTSAGGQILNIADPSTAGNNNNLIDNNDITNAGGNRPYAALMAKITSVTVNSQNNTISNNDFFDFLNPTAGSYGIQIESYHSGYSIIGNSFYETAEFATTTDQNYTVIRISPSAGYGFTVSGNYIGGRSAHCGGLPWTKTGYNGGFSGITVSTSGAGTANAIHGNTIKNISWTCTGANDFQSISLSGSTAANIGTVTGNTIGDASGTGSIQFTAGGTGANFFGIYIVTSGDVDCQNNVIGSITAANASTNATNVTCINKSTVSGNVTISNNTIGSSTANSIQASSTSTSTPQSVWGITSTGTGTATISNNIINNLVNAGTTGAGTYGMTIGINVQGGTNTITDNTVQNLSTANNNTDANGFGALFGIRMSNTSSSVVQTIRGNTVSNLSNSYASFGGAVIGIYYKGSTTAGSVSRNFIHSLSVSGASSTSAKLYGLKIDAGAATYSNNIVSLGGNTLTTIYGICQTGAASNDNNLYFNTVYISGTPASGSNFSYALYSSGTSNIRDFRNNVLVNARSTTGGSNMHFALYFDATTGTTLTCDYNNYFVSGTGGVLGYYGANKTSLPIVTGQTGNDANSTDYNPVLSGSGTTATDYTATAPHLAAAGTGITVDYSGTTRSVSVPAMGALANSCVSAANPTSAGTIDASQSGAGPFNPAAFTSTAEATGHTGTLEYMWQSSTTSSSAGFSLISGAKSSAYDAASMNYTTWFKRLARASCLSWTGASESNVLQVTVTWPVTLTATSGTASGYFNTLKAAFDAINAGTHKGDIVIKINNNTSESSTAALNASAAVSSSAPYYTSINIYPTTTGLSITGAMAAPLIKLNGANNVTIDGRVNATGDTKSLTISNTNKFATAGTSTIQFINDARSNRVQYCTIKGSSTDASGGIIFFSTTTGTTGNDNNTIDHNDITNAADADRPINALFAFGTSTLNNDGNTISNNNFFDFLIRGTTSYGINISSYNSAFNISGNSFYETASFTPTATANYIVIGISAATGAGNGFTVSGNYIGGNSALCAGTAWTKTSTQNNAFTSISVVTATGTANSIQGNTIQNFDWSNSGTASFTGISLSGATAANIGTTTGNTIGAATGTGSITFTSALTATDFYGINIASTDEVVCSNNTIGSITVANASTNATNFYGIYKSSTAGTTTISNNTIGSTTTASSINASSLSTSNAQSVFGIRSAGTGTVTISGNTIAKLVNATTNTTSGLISGINVSAGANTISDNTVYHLSIANANTSITSTASVSGIVMASTTASAQMVSGNTVYGLSNSYASFAGSVIGVYYQGSTTAGSVSRNFIHSLSVSGASSTSAKLYGLKIDAGAATYSNNIVSLGGNTLTTIYGIYQTGAASNDNNLYFNTVNISGSQASGTNLSYALYSTGTSNTRDFRNNILVNTRSTTGGSNKHYAMYIAASGGSLTCDYNNYFVSGTGGVPGYFGANKTSLPIVTGQTGNDDNSSDYNPVLSGSGTTATDYTATAPHLAATGTGITVDYSGTTRSVSAPQMGALANSCDAAANPTSGGTIAASQTGSAPFDPAAFTSSAAPGGYTGTLEYKWQSSTTSASAGFSDITGAISSTYDPAALSVTTWFKRLARASCQSWTGAAESNVLEATICTNPTSGGTIGSAQSGNTPFDPAAFTSSAAASGHTGTLEYKWQSSTTSSSSGFSDIASSNSATYDAGALTQSTWYKRLARVSCKADWTGAVASNVLKVTVSAFAAEPTAQPTALYFTTTGTSPTFNLAGRFTASASATGYLVVRNTGSAPTFTPVDGTAYSAGSQTGGTVVYSGSATDFTESGVTLDLDYYYAIYAFNGSGSSINYLTASPLSGVGQVKSSTSTGGSVGGSGTLASGSTATSLAFPGAGATVNFPSGTSGTTLSVTKNNSAPTSNLQVSSSIRGMKAVYFTITSSTASPGGYTLILDFSSLGTLSPTQWNSYKVTKRVDDKSPWVDVTTLGATIVNRQTDGVWGKFTITGLSSFSDFGLAETYDGVLVSNLDQTVATFFTVTPTDHGGQAFTTDGLRYQLSKLKVSVSAGATDLRARLYGSTSGNVNTSTILANFGTPAQVGSTSVYELTPTSTVKLEPGTQYWVVFYSASGAVDINYTGSLTESGPASFPTNLSASSNDAGSSYSLLNADPALFSIEATEVSRTWTGTTTTDWATAGNWTPSEIPGNGEILTIPNVANDPVLPANTSVSYLTVASGAVLTLTDKNLTVTHGLSHDGTMSATTGKLIMAGTVAQGIEGTGTITNLDINNAAGVAVFAGSSHMQTITGKLTPTAGTLTTNGNLTLRSDINGTARVGQGSASGGYISGNVVTQRYLTKLTGTGRNGRAWRLVTIPVTGTGTLRDAFMAGQSGTDLTVSANRSAQPADLGTVVIGHNQPDAATATGAGYDWIGVAGQVSSLRYYQQNATSGSFASSQVPNLNTTTYSSADQGYMIFARGDRQQTYNGTANSSPTVLQATGALKQGTMNVTIPALASAGYALVGNPYMAVLDLEKLVVDNAGVIGNTVYIWDANIDGNAFKQGGYRAVTRTGVNNWTASGAGANPQYIESGSAFFVVPTASGGTLSIREAHKVDGTPGIAPLGSATEGPSRLFINLEVTDTGTRRLVDGAVAFFDASYKDDLGDPVDIVPMTNLTAGSVTLRHADTRLSMEGRPWPADSAARTIPVDMRNLGDDAYVLRILPTNMSKEGFTAWLKDRHLNKETSVKLDGETLYPFRRTGDLGIDSSRFEIVYRLSKTSNSGTLTPDGAAGEMAPRLWPNPAKGTDVKLSLGSLAPGRYEIQVLDMSGRLALKKSIEHVSATAEHRILQGHKLSPGQYLIRISSDERPLHTLQLIQD